MWEELMRLDPAATFREEKWPKYTEHAIILADAIRNVTNTSLSREDIIFRMFTVCMKSSSGVQI